MQASRTRDVRVDVDRHLLLVQNVNQQTGEETDAAVPGGYDGDFATRGRRPGAYQGDRDSARNKSDQHAIPQRIGPMDGDVVHVGFGQADRRSRIAVNLELQGTSSESREPSLADRAAGVGDVDRFSRRYAPAPLVETGRHRLGAVRAHW